MRPQLARLPERSGMNAQAQRGCTIPAAGAAPHPAVTPSPTAAPAGAAEVQSGAASREPPRLCRLRGRAVPCHRVPGDVLRPALV